MSKKEIDAARRLMSLMFKAHPWHGVSMGDHAPDLVTAYIEIVPTDTVKYEVDKASGFLKVDRPQRFSNYCPSYYGLIPQTYCGERVAKPFGARAGVTLIDLERASGRRWFRHRAVVRDLAALRASTPDERCRQCHRLRPIVFSNFS